MNAAAWQARPEGGGRFAIWLIRGIALRLGRPVARALLYPITLYFLLARGPERRASRAFLGRALGRPARWRDLARHLHCFSATILDRVFLLSGRAGELDVRVHGLAPVAAVLDQRRGVLLLGAHLGSFEALRVLARERPGLELRVLLHRSQNPALTTLLEALDPAIADTVLDAGLPGPELVLAIAAALQRRALVGMLADRARAGEAVCLHPFLGAPAPFPLAPMRIAAATGVPVVAAFGLYRGGNRYDLVFELLAPGGPVPRAGREDYARSLQQAYVELLERQVRATPWNWFNFYDFWQGESSHEPAAGRTAA